MLLMNLVILLSFVFGLTVAQNCTTGDEWEDNEEMKSLDLGISYNQGLFVESSCFAVKKSENYSVFLEEYLFKELIHYESYCEEHKKKQIVVLNGTKYFKASLTNETSPCDVSDLQTGSAWNSQSLNVFDQAALSVECLPLSWILSTSSERTWQKKVKVSNGIVEFRSCVPSESGLGPETYLEMRFIQMAKMDVSVASLLEVSVVKGESESYTYTVYHVDVLGSEDASPLEMQQSYGLFQPPEGVVCRNYATRNEELVGFPDAMSLSTEIVDFTRKKIVYTSEFYNYDLSLARIELHSGGQTSIYKSARYDDPDALTHPVKMIQDFHSGLNFWLDSSNGDCGIKRMGNPKDAGDEIPMKDRMPVSKDGILDTYYDMYHPRDFYFYHSMEYGGRCHSHNMVPGFKYFYVPGEDKMIEYCFSDGTWKIGSIKNQTVSIPLYKKEFNTSALRRSPNFEPNVTKITNFFDIDFATPDASYFDISQCFPLDSSKHFIFRAEGRTSFFNETKGEVVEGNTVTPLFHRMPAFTSELRVELQNKLKVAPIRVFDIFVEKPLKNQTEYDTHSLVIGFGLLDIPPKYISSQEDQLERTGYRHLYLDSSQVFKVIETLLRTNQFKLNFTWFDQYTNSSGQKARGLFREIINITKAEIVSRGNFNKTAANLAEKKTYENEEKGDSSGGIGLGAIVCVAILMTFLGVALGIGVGYKLWKSGASFGYTIHTNI